MPDRCKSTVLPGPSTRDTEGEKHQRAFVSRSEAQNKAWLTWRSNGLEHGLKSHLVEPKDGSIREIKDPEPAPRRKPKAVSSRQWRRQ
jgi:hypothetical protein